MILQSVSNCPKNKKQKQNKRVIVNVTTVIFTRVCVSTPLLVWFTSEKDGIFKKNIEC